MAGTKCDTDKVDHLIQAATGVARILNIMACDAEPEDFAQSQAYSVLFDQLWGAVEEVTGQNPWMLGTRFVKDESESEEE